MSFDVRLTRPYGSVTISRAQDVERTSLLLAVALIVGQVTARSRLHRRRAVEASDKLGRDLANKRVRRHDRDLRLTATAWHVVEIRHHLGRRAQRVAALAQITAVETGLVADAARRGPCGFCHFAARPGDLVAFDTFYVGKLKGCQVHGHGKGGAAFGYTGVLGYHPLVATRAYTGEVLHARLRKGPSQRGTKRFAEELIARVRRAGGSGALTVRADAGFWNYPGD